MNLIPVVDVPAYGLLLALAAAGACYGAWRSRKSEVLLRRSLQALRTTVQFLEAINTMPLVIPESQLHKRLTVHLQDLLKPFHIHSRLWIYNSGWKTLQGFGEHPSLRPGSSHHLPISACPAFALRRPEFQ
jgi:hypothetical protein